MQGLVIISDLRSDDGIKQQDLFMQECVTHTGVQVLQEQFDSLQNRRQTELTVNVLVKKTIQSNYF